MNVIKHYFNEFTTGIKTMFKEFFKKDTNKKQRANMWTFSRLISSAIIPVLTLIGVFTNSLPVLIVAFTTAGFGALTDFFDGRSARKHNSSSKFGALLDAASDKAYTTLLGVSLSMLNPVFLLNIVGEIAITLTNLIYKILHEEIEMKTTKVGKIKQWPLSLTFILGILSILYPSLTTITNITIIITLIAQLATINSYVINNNNQIKEASMKNIDNKEIPIDNEQELDITKQKRKEELINLRNVLNNILQEELSEKKNNPKTRRKKIQ